AAVSAATVAAPALALAGAGNRAVELAERSFDQRLELGDQPRLMEPGIHVVSMALAQAELGDVEKAEALARAAYEAAVEARQIQGHAWLALILGRVLWLRRLPESLRWFREAASLFSDLDQAGQRRWCVAGGMMVAAMHGDAAAVAELAVTTDSIDPGPVQMMASDVMRARAWACVARGDQQDAKQLFRRAGILARARGAFALEVGARHDLVRLGEPGEVVDRLAELATMVDGELATVRADHAAALASGDTGNLEQVAERFETCGVSVLAAEAMAQAAALHRRAESARAAQRCGQRAAELDALAGGVCTPAMALAGEAAALTRREREITELAAQGLSNQDIADRLVVSRRTVANHLQRAYDKLGVAGRQELAAALGTSGRPPA
ncbi:MAG: helix-turn-helix transcriptional regulator, partial [Actinobacteria bacterium]|nr:helix-turn-helix transcriptional regulator [Actinomycetota bacterium]